MTLTFDLLTTGSLRADILPYVYNRPTKSDVDSSNRFSFSALTHTKSLITPNAGVAYVGNEVAFYFARGGTK